MQSFNPFLVSRENVFEFSHEKIVAELRVKETPKGDFAFFFMIHDTDENLKASIAGTTPEEAGDVRSRELESGEAYFVRTLKYEGPEGKINFLIDLDYEAYAWVEIIDCPQFDGPLELPNPAIFRAISG